MAAPHCIDPACKKASQDDHENQCAIWVSYALKNAGFNMEDYTEPKASDGVARGAEFLANFLWKKSAPPDRCGRNDAHKLSGREGIVVLKDFDNVRKGRGVHIELWDGEKPLSGKPQLFERCQQVWFWETQA